MEIIIKKTALITGITGQDGSYLSEFLLSKNYEDYLKIDKKLLRPNEVDFLIANSSKAKKILKWRIQFHLKN